MPPDALGCILGIVCVWGGGSVLVKRGENSGHVNKGGYLHTVRFPVGFLEIVPLI